MTPKWVGRHARGPGGRRSRDPAGPLSRRPLAFDRKSRGLPVELGPEDLRDLPRFFGQADDRADGYGDYDIEILAEINHAPQLAIEDFIAQAERFVTEGADVIDLGCDPGGPWKQSGRGRHSARDRGIRVSIDSFDPDEVATAVDGGRRACPERERDQPRARRRLGRRGGGDPRSARLARRAWTRRLRLPEPARRRVSHRPDPRADRLRLRGLAGPLSRRPVAAIPTPRC